MPPRSLACTARPSTAGQAFIPLDSSQSQLAIAARIQNLRDQYQALLGSDPDHGNGDRRARAGRVRDASELARGARPRHAAVHRPFVDRRHHDWRELSDCEHVHATRRRVGAVGTIASPPTERSALAPASRRTETNSSTSPPAMDSRGSKRELPAICNSRRVCRGARSPPTRSSSARWPSTPFPTRAICVFPLDVPVPGSYSAGNVMCLSVIPRYRLAGYFAITGRYSVLHVTDDQYTRDAYRRRHRSAAHRPSARRRRPRSRSGSGSPTPRWPPTFAAPGACRSKYRSIISRLSRQAAAPRAKTCRDQIELRVYLSR